MASPTESAPGARIDLTAEVKRICSTHPSREAYAQMLMWRMRRYNLIQVLLIAFLIFSSSAPVNVGVCAAFALYRARTVWTIIHNRVHQPPLPHSPTTVFYDFCTGWIAIWWRKHHLMHHAHTNTPKDPDTRMFLGRDLNDVRDPPLPWPRRTLRNVTTLVQYPVFIALFFYQSLRRYRWDALPFIVGIIAYGCTLAWVLPPWEAQVNTACNMGIGTLYIVGTFAPNHTAILQNFQLRGSHRADQLVSSNNVWPESRWFSWLCGGLNQHIEHHLFPHVPGDYLSDLVPSVKQWADEQGLQYNRWSLWGIWRAHIRFMTR